jgi:hypothetical protein
MSDYTRTTRACTVSQLQPENRQAIREYFLKHDLGDPETQTRMCCETISEKKKLSKLASVLSGNLDGAIHTGMVLTSEMLIWVRSGDVTGTKLSAADLRNIHARAYTSVLTRDSGLEIYGFIVDSYAQTRGYIAMGAEDAAQKFCDEVTQAIKKANPPVESKWPKWLGGG